jgi:RHS repeat-associated protein
LAVDDIVNDQNIWVLPDYQGSATDLYVNGSYYDRILYDAYGRRVDINANPNAPSLGNQVDAGYLGMEFDSLTGRYQNQGRFYDPTGGRYLSPSAGGYLNGTTNLYVFANNTPVDRNSADFGAGLGEGQVYDPQSSWAAGASSIGNSFYRFGRSFAQLGANIIDADLIAANTVTNFMGLDWQYEAIGDIGRLAERGEISTWDVASGMAKGFATNVADTLSFGGYAAYQYNNGDITAEEAGDRLIGAGLNYFAGAGLLKAAGLAGVTVSQAAAATGRTVANASSAAARTVTQLEFNPAALTTFYSTGVPLNILKKGVREFDIHEYGVFAKLTKNPADVMQAHELLGNNWLQKHGYIVERGTGLSRKNPAIALKTNEPHSFHQIINRLQREAGHYADSVILRQSWRENVRENIRFMVEAGVDRNIVAELAKQTRAFAIKNGL